MKGSKRPISFPIFKDQRSARIPPRSCRPARRRSLRPCNRHLQARRRDDSSTQPRPEELVFVRVDAVHRRVAGGDARVDRDEIKPFAGELTRSSRSASPFSWRRCRCRMDGAGASHFLCRMDHTTPAASSSSHVRYRMLRTPLFGCSSTPILKATSCRFAC
jgi:hypothetical protein